MNILRITPHYYFEASHWPSRFDPMGGMQVQITHLSEWLAVKGIRQDVLTTGLPGVPRKLKLHDNLHVHSVRLLTLPIKSKYTGTLFLDQSWFIGAMKWIVMNGRKNNYVAIHVHASGVVWPLLAATFAQRYLKKPLLLSIHCSRNFTYHPMNRWDRWIHKYVKSYELKTIMRSEKVVLLTKKRMESYENLVGDTSKMMEIGDCIAPNHLKHQLGCSFCQTLKGSFGNEKKVIFLGRIAYEKGWHTFVKVAKQLSTRMAGLQFIVCGDGPQRLEMEEEVARHGMKDLFHITGFISNQKVSCYLQQVDLMILPSQHEEFGGSMLEATFAGVPVITTQNGGPADIFTCDRTAILKDPNDVTGIAEKAFQILNEQLVGYTLLRNASLELIDRFLPDRVYSNYADLYGQYECK